MITRNLLTRSYKLLLTLLVLLMSTNAFAQRLTATGKVVDAAGLEVIGASVLEKGTTNGVVTNLDGEFSLSVGQNATLVISFIGYKTIEVKAATNMNITLQEDNELLDEVVVIGYGSVKRKDVTTAVSTVSTKDLDQRPIVSAAQALQGKAAGVSVMQPSGEPGGGMSIRVRGTTSFNGSNDPLYVVDGVPVDNINFLSPNDIENLSILKDASSAAIYGSRAANGVVLITTKRGEKGKVKINVKTGFSWNTPVKVPEYANAYDWASLANEALEGRYESPLYTSEEMNIIRYGLDSDLYPNVDWRDLMLKSGAPSYYANINFSGGSDNVRYFVSGQYTSEDGRYRTSSSENKYNTNTTYERWNYRANVDMNLTRSTILKVSVGGWLVNRNSPQSDADDIWKSFAYYTPLSSPRKWSTGQWPVVNGMTTPEYQMTQTGYRTIWESKVESSVALDQDLSFITKGLKFSGVFAFDTYNKNTIRRSKAQELWSAEYSRDANGNLVLKRVQNAAAMSQKKIVEGDKRYYLQASLDYSRLFAQKHRVGVFAMVYQQETTDVNFDESDLMGSIPHRNLAYSGRFTYAFQDKYMAEFNWGYTGSENFQPGRQFGFFPSISGAWVPSSYQWTKDKMPWLNYFKVRASYGLVGNDRITDKRFPYLTSINVNGSATTNWKYTKGGIWENSIGADNLEWEKAKKFDVGLEGKLFDKFEFVIDFFRDTRDGIFQERKQVPDFVGLVNMPFGNVGSMVSWGSDGNITFNQRINKDMEFTLRANFTYSTNKVNYYEEGDTKYEYTSATGRPNGYMKGYIALGLFKDQEEINNSPKQDFGSYLPGDIKYKDVNGDGVVNSDDQVPVSYQDYPRLMYGFGGEFRWKKLTLGVRFSGIGNTDYYKIWTWGSNNVGYIPFYDGKLGNVLTIAANPANRWIPADYDDPSIPASMRENPNAMFPRLSYGSNQNNAQASTFWKGNRKYLRLDEISLNYNWNCNLLKSIGINSIDLAVVANDLHTWDSVKLFDPELATSNGRAYPIPGRVSFQAIVHF